ncbi:MAG: DUF3473 domain-containing protein [Alphaproteobacteria bacterium]
MIQPINAMTVDVEDYFQVQAFADHISHYEWDWLPWRVERNTDRILALFAAAGVRATFFTLGWVAERHPALIRRIVDAGHELASHGYAHHRVDRLGPDGFRADIRRTRALLEDIGGVPVRGYRAPTFSIAPDMDWAFTTLAEEGYTYSSSVFPIHHDLYGSPGAPRFPFRPGDGRVIECPVTTVRVLGRNLPCGGGGYFRLLPYQVSRWGMRRVNGREARPCVFYVHPWEIDPGQPRLSGLPLAARARHFVNLHRVEDRLRRLLKDFSWDRLDRVLFNV